MENLVAQGAFTDFYQLTMAQAFFLENRHEQKASFYYTFRRAPFGQDFALICGQEVLLEGLSQWSMGEKSCQYLKNCRRRDGSRLFCDEFISYLSSLRLDLSLAMVEEGSVVFPHLPLVRASGPLVQLLLIESSLLNCLNFQTLIATKACALKEVVGEDELIEFGLRRAQGPSGAMLASRAAYIGGADATSNTLAAVEFGLPVRGTHAHSWVMAHATEEHAFAEYQKVYPLDGVYLVDTYDTLAGVEELIKLYRSLPVDSPKPLGVRLDSGDMVSLSQEVRARLDSAGLGEVKIVASNDLDVESIQKMKQQGAAIDVWGVGTNLVTAKGEPALGGVYKMSALEIDGEWQAKMKNSEEALKASWPGMGEYYRLLDNQGKWWGDGLALKASESLVDLFSGEKKTLPPDVSAHQQMKLLFDQGKRVGPGRTLCEIKERVAMQLQSYRQHKGKYPLFASEQLYHLREELRKTEK